MARGGLRGLGHIPYERDAYWEECCHTLGYICPTKKDFHELLGYRALPTVEKMHRSRATHRVLTGGNRCLTADMRVQTQHGWIPSDEVGVGDSVACKSSKKRQPRKDEVVAAWKSPEKERIYKLRTKRGYTLRGNAEHPLWAREEYQGKQEWKTLDSLSPGNWVALERSTDVWPEECLVTVEEAYFLGLMTGDGCWVKHDGAMSCSFDERDEDSAERLTAYLHSQGITPYWYDKRNQKSFSVEWCDIAFKRMWANRLPLVRSKEKTVPELVLRGTREVVAAFLRGLFDADGCATTDGKVVFVSTSKVLAEQAHSLLLKLGVYSSLYVRPPELKWRRPSTTYRIQAGGSAARAFAYEIGFECKRKQARLTPEKPSNRVYWDKVVSVEFDGFEHVYGVTTKDTHTYVANGFISHNSGKTYGGMMEVIPYLLWPNTHGWVVSATYSMAMELANKVEDILLERGQFVRAARSTNLRFPEFYFSKKDFTFTMYNGSTFQLKSADSPNSMHAVPLDYCVVDEAALLPYSVYDTRLVPRLADSGGWILAMGTFELLQGDWFENYYDIGQTDNDLGIASWMHPTEDNFHVYTASGGETARDVADVFHVPWRRIERDNPGKSWPLEPGTQVLVYNIDIEWLRDQKGRMAKETYAARFEAKRATSPYRVFPSWEPKVNVDAKRCAFDPDLPVYLAIDPGGTYAVAAVQMKRFDDTGSGNKLTRGLSMCVLDELYFQTTVTTHEVFAMCQEREWWPNVARFPWPHFDSRQGVIDVTQHEQKRTWRMLAKEDKRIKSIKLMGQKVNIEPGNATHQYYLDTGSFFCHPKCTFVSLEHQKYTYAPPSLSKLDSADPRKGKPVDAWNHLVKALIYLEVCLYGYYGRKMGSRTLTRWEVRKAKEQAKKELDDRLSNFGGH